MRTRKLSPLEKLSAYPVFMVFVVIAAASLGWFPYGIDAVLKLKFIFIVNCVGVGMTICIFAVRLMKKTGATNRISLAVRLLISLAYFSFYFGVNKAIVVGICLAGIPISVLSIQEMRKNLTII